jgi:arsenate reductase (thioredoxin)
MMLFRYLAAVLIVPFAFAGQKAEGNKSGAPAQVLFVCEHGAAKSIIAATYFNKLARERGLPQHAIARGTQPDPAYSPSVVRGLKGDGLEVGKGRPTVVTDADIAAATHVVTLGCKLPHPPSPSTNVRAWDDITMTEGYSAARRAIVKRVEKLLDELSTYESR